jgi:hypothetical protein
VKGNLVRQGSLSLTGNLENIRVFYNALMSNIQKGSCKATNYFEKQLKSVIGKKRIYVKEC